MTTLPGSSVIRSALRDTLGDAAASAATVTDLLSEPLDRYAELVASVGGDLAGFMTRGEDRGFTTQTAVALEYLGMSPDARAHHAALATWMEHRRGFTKVEWTAAGSGEAAPLVACYFRRRPQVIDVIARMADWGVAPIGRELVAEVAGVLAKTTIHFVAAAFRPGSPIHHKFYFSQFVAADTYGQVAARIEALVRRFGGTPGQLAFWQRMHAATVHLHDSTIFVSISTTTDQPSPSFKVDYPEVTPARAASWNTNATAIERAATTACTQTGCSQLSYLGVRFQPGQDMPALKCYADVPGLADAAGRP